MSLRGPAVVVVDDAAEYVATLNRTGTAGGSERDRNLLVDALVRTRRIVVNDELAHQPLQMCLVDDQHLVQTLITDRSHPMLGKGVGIGCTIGGEDHFPGLRSGRRRQRPG